MLCVFRRIALSSDTMCESESTPVVTSSPSLPDTFEDLAASRRQWIDEVLHPWCRKANLKQLRRLEPEWLDIAGRVDVNATLWTWAWERFAGLTHPEMAGVNETYQIRVALQDGTAITGFPDSRLSIRGMLVIIGSGAEGLKEHGPFAIDDIVSVEAVE